MKLTSRPGEASRVFAARVGQTLPARAMDPADVLVDRDRFESEGDWAFCRFDSEAIPAVRFGYQLGSFDIGPEAGPRDPALLQLHLEVMTADGGLLWVPTGVYSGDLVASSATTKDTRLVVDTTEILRISGWPQMTWRMRSKDGELEVEVDVGIETVTVLPDALLPQAVFGMWETMGRARGHVRVGAERFDVDGHMFFDHTRVRHVHHDVPARQLYLYTTLALEDGSGVFGYHAVNESGATIDDYCFGIHVDASGAGTFLGDARVSDIETDADGLPERWQLAWRADGLAVEAVVTVRPLPLKRGWGGPLAPTSRASWPIFPLVLDADLTVTRAGATAHLRGRGLAEYFDAGRWFGED